MHGHKYAHFKKPHAHNLVYALLPLLQPALSLSCTSLLPPRSLHFIISPSHPSLSFPSYLPLSSDPVFPHWCLNKCVRVHVQTCCLYVRLPGQWLCNGGMTVRERFAISALVLIVWCTCTLMHALAHSPSHYSDTLQLNPISLCASSFFLSLSVP